jgi:RHS repeat-associated protein
MAPGNVLLRAGRWAPRRRSSACAGRACRTRSSSSPRATEYAWDGRDLLKGATLPDGTRVAIRYDALGRRASKQVAPGDGGRERVTEYVWDGDVLAMQLDSVDGPRTFVHAPGARVPLLHQEGGEVFAYLFDQVGTPTELLTADGLVAWSASRSAWGPVVAEHCDAAFKARGGRPPSSPFRLLGQIADDELGLAFTRFRMFDADVGRWLSADPLGIAGGCNAYAFDGAPTHVVDLWGLNTTGAQGGGHPTAEAAAVAAMQGANPQSQAMGKEVGGWVHQNPDGTYSAGPVATGTPTGLPNMPQPGPGDVAWWHTHPAVPGYDGENFSQADYGYSRGTGSPGYVATPSGAIKKFDPGTSSVSTLPQTAPAGGGGNSSDQPPDTVPMPGKP